MRIAFTEESVQNEPPGMEGWRLWRIEYGGHGVDCVAEGRVWLPPGARPRDMSKTRFIVAVAEVIGRFCG